MLTRRPDILRLRHIAKRNTLTFVSKCHLSKKTWVPEAGSIQELADRTRKLKYHLQNTGCSFTRGSHPCAKRPKILSRDDFRTMVEAEYLGICWSCLTQYKKDEDHKQHTRTLQEARQMASEAP